VAGHDPIGGEQGQLPGLLRLLIKGFDHPAPSFVLLSLISPNKAPASGRPCRRRSACSRQCSVAVLFAVFEASVPVANTSRTELTQRKRLKRYLVFHYRRSQTRPLIRLAFLPLIAPNRRSTSPVEKVGLATPAAADSTSRHKPGRLLPEGPAWYDNKLYYVEYGRNTVDIWDGADTRFSEAGWLWTICRRRRCEGEFLVTCYDSNSIGRISADGKTLDPL